LQIFFKSKYMSYRKGLLAGIIFLFSAACFYACSKKDNVYKAEVTVLRLNEAGGTVPVPNCKLVFGQDTFAPDIRREVYTDATGKYVGEWTREVSLDIHATVEIDGQTYVGFSRVRLSLATIAKQEILIKLE